MNATVTAVIRSLLAGLLLYLIYIVAGLVIGGTILLVIGATLLIVWTIITLKEFGVNV